MLSEPDNEILTRVGPGTVTGELLRRYWTPALLSAELPDVGGDPVRVRLLGEDLVAFRATDGRVGLVQENCPHRGASLFYGRNEDGPDGTCGLRCVYHGWQFDVDGRCVDMPSEPATSTFKERVRARAYPTHESGGVVWTYMGPAQTMTPFRDFGTETLSVEHHDAFKLRCECNWIQTMEGNLDTAHISWLHSYPGIADIDNDGTDKPGYPSEILTWKFWLHDRAPRIDIHDTWYGFRYAGIRTTPNGNTNVRITEYVFPYSTIIAGIPFATRNLMVVPIDDNSCWRYTFAPTVPADPAGHAGPSRFAISPYANDTGVRLPSGEVQRDRGLENDFLIDRDQQRTETFTGIRNFVSQDQMVTESMGPIYDRTQERLGTIDKAIIRMRNQIIRSAKALAQDPNTPLLALAGTPEHDFRSIRAVDKNLDEGEDWRTLGLDDDPAVREVEEWLQHRSETTSG